MFSRSRPMERKIADARKRWFVGLYLTTNCRRLEAGLVGLHGWRPGNPIEVSKGIALELPEEFVDFAMKIPLKKRINSNSKSYTSTERLKYNETKNEFSPQLLHDQLLEIQVELVHELLSQNGVIPGNVSAIGLLGPGDTGNPYPDLHDNAVALAKRTGLNVVNGFALSDLAMSGQGCPLIPFPAWILLHSNEKHRLLIDLGQNLRLTLLPSAKHATKEQIHYDLLCPCGSIIDPLVFRITKGEKMFDDGGRLTVQGQVIPQLREFWIDQFLTHDPSSLLQTAFKESKSQKWSLRDLLCTAVHCISDITASYIQEQYGSLLDELEIFVTGGARHHGLLMKQLNRELSIGKLESLNKTRFSCETFDAHCVAVLASLMINQIPGNLPHLTDAGTDSVLGRLTPGSAQNWQRLIQDMAETKPLLRSLRSVM